MSHCRRSALIVLLLGFLLPTSLSAQAKTHGYVSAGAGATDVNGGVDWVVADGPLSIGGEVGVGWVFLGALKASYHLLNRRASTPDVFATVGYAGIGSSEIVVERYDCRRWCSVLAGGPGGSAL